MYGTDRLIVAIHTARHEDDWRRADEWRRLNARPDAPLPEEQPAHGILVAASRLFRRGTAQAWLRRARSEG
jgi:hypothetical protein